MLKERLSVEYFKDPLKKPLYVYAALWLSTYVVRIILVVFFGDIFLGTTFSRLTLWMSGVFFGLLLKELIIYKKRETSKILKEAEVTDTDLMKIIDGASTKSEYVDDMLIDAEDSISKRRHVYRDLRTGKLYAFEYAIGYDNEILEDYLNSDNVFEVEAVEKTVTVYEKV